MKKCPNCQKEFPDSMRFCQSDGTPLVDVVEEVQEDPLKTTVVRQEDISSSIPSSDPFKTMVAGSSDLRNEEEDDLLQLPEEIDPMKTMVVPPLVGQNKPKEKLDPEPTRFDSIKEEIRSETPPPTPSSLGGFSGSGQSGNLPVDSPFSQPEPPKFSEPNLSPPNFGDLSSKQEEEDMPATVFQGSSDPGNVASSDESPFSSERPFGRQESEPIPSPFDRPGLEAPPAKDEPMFGQQQSSFNDPPSPFGQPQTPFEAPKNIIQEPESPYGSAQQQFNQMNEPSVNQPLQQTDWTPPPSPGSGWQEQGLGPQTPFQPPVAMQGQNQVLPIVSLVFGLVSLCCYIAPVTGLVALITGFMGMKNANNDPNHYGGKGLAIAGMVVGGVLFLVGVLYWLYIIFVIGIAGLTILGAG